VGAAKKWSGVKIAVNRLVSPNFSHAEWRNDRTLRQVYRNLSRVFAW
jgi:hypothetical protein